MRLAHIQSPSCGCDIRFNGDKQLGPLKGFQAPKILISAPTFPAHLSLRLKYRPEVCLRFLKSRGSKYPIFKDSGFK